jgi:hypothetical protein
MLFGVEQIIRISKSYLTVEKCLFYPTSVESTEELQVLRITATEVAQTVG